MSSDRIALGKSGEDLAVAELERQGYAILERRWRARGGEIDIIAFDRDTLVFVEVKAKAGREFGDAFEAVTAGKRRRLVRLATQYAAGRRWLDRPCRFDIVAIQIGEDRPVVTLYRNAFDA